MPPTSSITRRIAPSFMSTCMSLMWSMVKPSKSGGNSLNITSLRLMRMRSVFQRAPIKTSQLQGISNDRVDRIPIPYVKEDEALAEDLRLVVGLDAQSLFRVERSETFRYFAQDIFVHGITSSEIGSTFPAGIRL